MAHLSASTLLGILAIVPSLAGTPCQAQGRPEWLDLGQQSNTLKKSEAGNFTGAIAAAREEISAMEAKVGPDHVDLLDKLEQLGMLYLARSNIPAAETTFKRGLTISERALGPNHQKTIAALNGLLAAYLMDGRMVEAEAIMKRTRATP